MTEDRRQDVDGFVVRLDAYPCMFGWFVYYYYSALDTLDTPSGYTSFANIFSCGSGVRV